MSTTLMDIQGPHGLNLNYDLSGFVHKKGKPCGLHGRK